MLGLINNIFLKFAWETGILGSIREFQNNWVFVLILIGILACFFGYKTYRTFFSLLVFMGIATACSLLMREYTDWGSIVTTFSVIGITLALLAYRWVYLGALVINILITIGLVANVSNSLILGITLSIIVGFITIYFPVISVCALTSIFGGIVITELFNLTNIGMFLLIIGGVIIQNMTNKNQVAFEKPYPDSVMKFYENRKVEGQNVRSSKKRN